MTQPDVQPYKSWLVYYKAPTANLVLSGWILADDSQPDDTPPGTGVEPVDAPDLEDDSTPDDAPPDIPATGDKSDPIPPEAF